ncbi:MAG: hypothetical protein ABSB55_00725 [Acidimicrobiales bacterium]|jgi:hypothetical protein
MRGRWAAGIVPRNFAWIIKGHLALSERPGGSAPDHRRVRRQEEILWLRAQGFTRVVSLLSSTHNLHAYEELGLEYSHVPMGVHADIPTVLGELYPQLLGWLHAGDRILVHQDELGDRVAGVFAGFLWWSGMIPEPPLAISAIEHLLRRQLGAAGRTIATLAQEVPLPPEEDRPHPAPPPEETVVALRPEAPEAATPAPAGRTRPATLVAVPTGEADAAPASVADLSSRRRAARPRRAASVTTRAPAAKARKPTPTKAAKARKPTPTKAAKARKPATPTVPRKAKQTAGKTAGKARKAPARAAPAKATAGKTAAKPVRAGSRQPAAKARASSGKVTRAAKTVRGAAAGSAPARRGISAR